MTPTSGNEAATWDHIRAVLKTVPVDLSDYSDEFVAGFAAGVEEERARVERATRELIEARPQEVAPKIAVDAAGYMWRVYNDHWSMAPSNPDNEPVPEPITFYVPEVKPA